MITDAVKPLKIALRQQIKQRIVSLSAAEKSRQTETVLGKLYNLSEFQTSRRVSVYLSTVNEVNTEQIVKKIIDTGRSCFVPRYDGELMQMVKLHSMNDYETLPLTKWNIKQPSLFDRREDAFESGGLDLIIVPGVAFTVAGDRLGHGKGYYDVYLKKCFELQPSRPKTVALAFNEQIVESIPTHEFDVKIDVVLSPQK